MDNPHATFHIKAMASRTDILIVGGGLNGSLLSLGLAGMGFDVTLIEAQEASVLGAADFDGRSYALALTSCRMLDRLGLWPHLQDNAQPILQIKVSDGHAGQGPSPLAMQFDHGEIEEGPMGHMIEDRHLRAALLQAVAAHAGIRVMSGQTVVDQSAGQLHLSSGETLSAQLIVGADGRASGTAQRAGIGRIGWDYGQTAMVCAVSHAEPHEGIAHQFFMPTGPLAILPLTGNRSSIVWSETAENAAAFHALNDADYLTMLRPRFGAFLGEIDLAGKRYCYPLSLSLTHRMVADRIALVGDATHGVHPIAGQGLNAGFRDIAALCDILHDARQRGEDIGSVPVLTRYEEWRRFDNTALALATDGFNRLFSNNNPILRIGRDIGMGLINRLPGLRRGFIREAAGLTGDVPRLMQG
jgi:2-octaprenyl-6-methoxyphenol hydroxylase